MGARIIHLSEVLASRAGTKSLPSSVAAQSAGGAQASELKSCFHFWSGASGHRYVHTVYSLVDCPEVPAGNYLLVKRDVRGQRIVLATGHLNHLSGSLNLAELRRRGARLGANEVHVHLLAQTAHERRLVEADLRGGQTGIGEPRVAVTRH